MGARLDRSSSPVKGLLEILRRSPGIGGYAPREGLDSSTGGVGKGSTCTALLETAERPPIRPTGVGYARRAETHRALGPGPALQVRPSGHSIEGPSLRRRTV